MEKQIIGRGFLTGAAAGFLAFIFSWIFLEPVIGRAIDYESGRDAAQATLDNPGHSMAGMDMGDEVFSRSFQSTVGLATGLILFGISMGLLFAVVFTLTARRTGVFKSLAPLVAGGMFLTIYLVPFLKYPANPPAVGHGESIKERTALWLTMVVCTGAFLLAAMWLRRHLVAKFGEWNASLLAAAAFAVAIGIVMFVLPSLGHLAVNVAAYGDHATETPLPLRDSTGHIVYPGFDADVLYRFRLYSVIAQAIIWAVIGLAFAPLAAKMAHESTSREQAVAV